MLGNISDEMIVELSITLGRAMLCFVGRQLLLNFLALNDQAVSYLMMSELYDDGGITAVDTDHLINHIKVNFHKNLISKILALTKVKTTIRHEKIENFLLVFFNILP